MYDTRFKIDVSKLIKHPNPAIAGFEIGNTSLTAVF